HLPSSRSATSRLDTLLTRPPTGTDAEHLAPLLSQARRVVCQQRRTARRAFSSHRQVPTPSDEPFLSLLSLALPSPGANNSRRVQDTIPPTPPPAPSPKRRGGAEGENLVVLPSPLRGGVAE